jgi:hypothetical protein
MYLYLDDDIAKRALVRRLSKEGHSVVIPSDVGCAGVSDPRHFRYAVVHDLVLLSKNYKDCL